MTKEASKRLGVRGRKTSVKSIKKGQSEKAAEAREVIFTLVFMIAIIVSLGILSIPDSEYQRGLNILLKNSNAEAINYKALSAPFLLKSYFSEVLNLKENLHMKDVDKLAESSALICVICLIVSVIATSNQKSVRKKKKQKGVAKHTSNKKPIIIKILLFAATTLLVVIVWSIVLRFHSIFILFHKIVFPDGNWSFPGGSYLIRAYPESFFWVATIDFLAKGVLISFAWLSLRKIKEKT